MRAKEEAFRILETALSVASTGVDDAEVCLGGGDLGITSFADNQLPPAVEQSIEVLSVRISSKSRIIRAETADMSAAGITLAVQAARALVEHLPAPEQPIGFAPPQTYWPVDAYDADVEAMTGLDRMAAVGRAVLLAHKQGLSASGFMATRRGALGFDGRPGIYAIANTRGLLAYHASTTATFRVAMTGRNQASGWAEDESFAASALDIEDLARSAARKAVAGSISEPARIGPGRYTVVLEPAALASILRFIGETCGSEDVETNRSFLSGTRGQKIVGENISIIDDHTHPLHRGCPFDIEGVAKRKVVLVNKGVAGEPVYGFGNAVRWGAEPTGHRAFDPRLGERELASHLVLEGGTATLSDLVGSTKTGLLVSRLVDTRLLDPQKLLVTGVARDGLFLLEGGEIARPLQPLRFTVSVLDVLRNVEAMTAPAWAEGLVVPAAKVHGFAFTSGIHA